MGPIDLDFAGYVGLRLNEHALHSWDIDVALHPDATVAPDATAIVIDNLLLIARFTAKPTGSERTIVVRTSDPTRTFTVALTANSVTTTEGEGDGRVDLELPAEAWIRLVYGRLDRAEPSAEVDELRRVFPGP